MLCFAYGMNLDPSYMTRDMHERGTGVLRNWKLTFRGFANVEPAEGEEVIGALWEIDEEGLRYLDRREGHVPGSSRSLYDRLTVLVDNGDEQVEAVMYVMSRDTQAVRPLHAPRYGYLGIVYSGYKHFHLDEDALWKAVRASCGDEEQFDDLRHYVEKGAEQHA